MPANGVTNTRARKTEVKYSDALADHILGELACGRSLVSVCADRGMPSRMSVFRWLRDNEQFRKLYDLAKAESSDALADDIQEVADKTLNGDYDPNAARVAVDAKKWVASKLKPKKYGDKLDLTSGGEKLPTPIYSEGMINAGGADSKDTDSDS